MTSENPYELPRVDVKMSLYDRIGSFPEINKIIPKVRKAIAATTK
jgi:hypothetical protein